MTSDIQIRWKMNKQVNVSGRRMLPPGEGKGREGKQGGGSGVWGVNRAGKEADAEAQ